MPHHDFLPRLPRLPIPPHIDPFGTPFLPRSTLRTLALVAMLRRGRKGKDKDPGRVPVEPNRPNTLSGGAAAPLEFDGE
jgi:hypothetical protein